jgi:hypothetical protein
MLNPLLLWFLPLAALPVLLHLLNLHNLRDVELPTYRFLMEGYVRQRRRIRLVEWLLLALRTAIVLLAVWALSRPVVERFGAGRSRDVAFVVDAGMTTGLVSAGTSALQRSREAVRAAASRLRPGDFVTLVRAGIEPTLLHRAALGDGRRFAAELDAIQPDPGAADLAAGIATVLSGPPRGPRTVWVVSDCERRAWRRLRERSASLRLPDDVSLVVADVGVTDDTPVRNVAILGEPPRSQRPVVGLPVELTVRLAAAGVDAPVATRVTVRLDGDIVSQVPIEVPPGRTAVRTLAVIPPRPGVLRGRVDIPGDAYPEDDSLLFVLNVEPRVDVLVVAPPGLQPLFDPALFLKAALESPGSATAAGAAVNGPADGASPIAGSLDVTVRRADTLDERTIRGADVIFLVEQWLDGNRMKWLRERVEAGAGLVVLAGSQKHGDADLREFLRGAAQTADAISVRLRAPVGDVDDESSARTLAAIDFSHPVFASFRSADDRRAADDTASVLDTLRIFRHEPLEIASADADRGQPRRRGATVVMARLDDGTPVMAECRCGRGSVVVSGLPVTPDWSNLPVHPAFVPLMLRLVQHVRPAALAVAAESVYPFDPAPIRLQDSWRRAVVQAIGPEGGRRAIPLVAGDEGVTGAYDDTGAVGYYEFDVEPAAGSVDAPLRLGMAVNADVETAAFEHVAAAEIEEALAPRPVTVLAGTAEDPTLHARLTGRRELTSWLIVGLFTLFAVEFLLSTLRPPAPAGGDGPPRTRWERAHDWLGRAVGSTGGPATA